MCLWEISTGSNTLCCSKFDLDFRTPARSTDAVIQNEKFLKKTLFYSAAYESMSSLEYIWSGTWQPACVYNSWTRGSGVYQAHSYLFTLPVKVNTTSKSLKSLP